MERNGGSKTRRRRAAAARIRLAALTLALTWLTAGAAQADEPSLALSLGGFNISKTPKKVEAGVELRLPTAHYGLEIVAGLSGGEEGNLWLYGGLRRDFMLEGGWFVTPGFAIALYEDGDGKNLGGPLEFRSSIELAYRFDERQRVGVALYHLSNAGIYDLNPGSNSLVATYAFSLGGR